jgi:hypothetical protein
MVGRNEDTKRYFNIPEWVYYQIEYYLWIKNSSFYGAPLTWDPEKGDGALVLRIDSMLRTMLPQAYGYAEAYLTSYKLYGIREGSIRPRFICWWPTPGTPGTETRSDSFSSGLCPSR